MMKVKVSFDTWVQLLGMLGVLGGLVFVGLKNAADSKDSLSNSNTGTFLNCECHVEHSYRS